MARPLTIGLDVGSTTAKAVVLDAADNILWRDYQRHGTKQAEKTLEILEAIHSDLNQPAEQFRIFITGSGGANLAELLGARFVQEVNAVSLAVERLFPQAGSVIELGGQDAKIIIFRRDPQTGKVTKVPSMNDKCAGGTGAVIDKINAKLRIPPEELSKMGYLNIKLHPVAGKCGVFAETDINSLQKMGVPPDQLMASLFDAIVTQNLSVLTRGNTLRPEVLLLGGPNTFIKGMVEAWRFNIPKIWEERKIELPAGVAPEELIKVPENAHYFAAIGAVEFGKGEPETVGVYRGTEALRGSLQGGAKKVKKNSAGTGLVQSDEDLARFLEDYKPYQFTPPVFERGQKVTGFIGIDGGSTSTKAVLLDEAGEIQAITYQLSKGNPIEDTKDVLRGLRTQVTDFGADLEILGVGTTGYAKDILKDSLAADTALVETVAHTESALHFYDNVDVICDVGGQDIKLMILQKGRVKDFKLNTQCSAGNGYFLQSTAQGFGVPVEAFAETAFEAADMPSFGYGCAVFMQSDIVDFQRQGWQPAEIMAGLAAVLPKNIWLYVSQIPNLAALGTTFLLQGGTQRNLAAVKAQVDFIRSKFAGKAVQPKIIVHKHCGESGAIGAAIEARRLYQRGHRSGFVGFDAVEKISYVTHRSEDTRCFFCKNKCLRTFIDVKVMHASAAEPPRKSKIPIVQGTKRLIVGNSCERGLVEDVESMKVIKQGMDEVKDQNPNMAEIAATAVWRSFSPAKVADAEPTYALRKATKLRIERMRKRKDLRIGIPRVLNQYSLNPLFSAYFESLGVTPQNLVYSDFTSEELYKSGAKRGAIDPCFPSKVAIPHVHNLLYVKHRKKPIDLIFFPMIDTLDRPLHGVQNSCACPTVTTTPESVKAAFTKEGNLFEEFGVRYLDPMLNINEPSYLRKQLWDTFKDILGLSEEENERALSEGYKAFTHFQKVVLQQQGREIIDMLERESRLGIVLLGRPYHNDPGINHGILENLQALGYPVLTQDSLPYDQDMLDRLFGEEVGRGVIPHPLSIADAWKNSYSENTNRKVWGAKFTARHPNLVALELSSFKCGHDAPIYTVIEEIIERSGTPYFCFKDIDENKPSGSIKIRIETMDYFLRRYRETLVERRDKRAALDEEMREFERQLRAGFALSDAESPHVAPLSDAALVQIGERRYAAGI